MNKEVFPINSYKLAEEGLGRALGALELSVMKAVWELESCSIKDVHDHLSQNRDISFNAVMTVMNRLKDKGLLGRTGKQGGYQYSALFTQSQLSDSLAKQVTQSLVKDFGEYAVPHFLASLDEISPDALQLIRDHLDRIEGE